MVKHARLRYARVEACTWQQCTQSPYCIQQGTCIPTSQSLVHSALGDDLLWCWSGSSGRWDALGLVRICTTYGKMYNLTTTHVVEICCRGTGARRFFDHASNFEESVSGLCVGGDMGCAGVCFVRPTAFAKKLDINVSKLS
jgi:hypothetical protein